MADKTQTSEPSAATRKAEEQEARSEHSADREPTADEEKAAPGGDDIEPGVADSFEEMARRGANVKGEGEVP